VHPASVAYYLTPPVFTFLATWALWRLLRLWAPRAVAACFVVGIVYWLMSAQLLQTPGSFFLGKMWQGKVVFLAWLVPTLYALLTGWVGRRDARTALLLLAAGVAAIGMTGSAAFVAPLVIAAGAVPLVARREWGGLPVLAGAAAFPFFVGFAATRIYPLAELLGAGEHATSWYFENVFGTGLVAAVGAVALVSAPWLARRGSPRRVVSGIVVLAVALLAPGILQVLQEASGASGALRRTLWAVPLPALVGLLAAVPLGALVRRSRPLARAAVAVPALILVGLLTAFGNPLWDSQTGRQSYVTARPTWKTEQVPLAKARAILALYGGEGPILADKRTMGAIALLTVDPKAVNPREWYMRLTGESKKRKSERLLLTEFVSGPGPQVRRAQARAALADLDVDLVCVDGERAGVIREVMTAGPYRPAFSVAGVECLRAEGPGV
jgi:hypothetical protein